eukprot:NODE_28_length_33831_cov_0.361200.p22 type:complete len:102 gc:universal NODE_28_length_33831_cov_0.361200:3411-3106(-)
MNKSSIRLHNSLLYLRRLKTKEKIPLNFLEQKTSVCARLKFNSLPIIELKTRKKNWYRTTALPCMLKYRIHLQVLIYLTHLFNVVMFFAECVAIAISIILI